MMNVMRKVVLLLLALLLMVVGLFSVETQRIERSFVAVKAVLVKTISGDLELKESSDSQIHVLVTHSYSSDTYETTLEMQGEELVLAETFSRGNFSGQSKWLVAVPKGCLVKFVSASGGCRAQNITVDLMIRNASGGIELSGVRGRVEVKTASGDLDGASIKGDVFYNGASGDIKLTEVEGKIVVRGVSSDFWGSGLSGDAEISLASGDLVVRESKLALSAKTASGDVSIRDVVLTGSTDLKSFSGSVLLRLAAPISADLALKSASGRVTLQLNGQAVDAEIVCTMGKDQGRMLVPFTFDSERQTEKNGQKYMERVIKLGKALHHVVISVASGDLIIEK